MCACTCLTENLGNRLAPHSHTARLSKCPKEHYFVSNESLSQILSISRGQNFRCCKSMESQGSWWGSTNLCQVKVWPSTGPNTLPWRCRQHRWEAAPCILAAHGVIAQCPPWATELMQCGFIIRPGNMRTQILQDNFSLLPQAVLHLLETSAVTGVVISSQPSPLAVKREAISYSISVVFLCPFCILQDGKGFT